MEGSTEFTGRHSANAAFDSKNREIVTIDSLPPEILMKIFGYLSHTERLRLEAVCRHWKQWSQETWKAVERLEISPPVRGFTQLKTISNNWIYLVSATSSVMKKILLLCGKTVSYLIIYRTISKNRHVLLSEYCHNLERLRSVTSKDPAVLNVILAKNPQLKSFEMGLNQRYFSTMKYLPSTLEELYVLKFEGIASTAQYAQMIKRLPALRCLQTPVDGVILDAVCTLKNLRSLTIWPVSCSLSANELVKVTKLCNLQCLNIRNMENVINEEFLMKLSQECRKIKKLCIGDPMTVKTLRGITKEGLCALSLLPDLEELDIEPLRWVMSDETLFKFSKLRKLQINRCTWLTDSGIILYIEMNENLEELRMKSFESQRIKKILAAAVEIIERRGNKQTKVIKIIVDDGNVASEFHGKSKYLKIH